ncbi:MAG: TIGR03960 family B12-binding radical SAM protein [Myxococcales bacterium]|nr:MAG: TIGR03960 family B12-binding radical SAM protein [Myxococcales bacterium]
MPHPTPAPHPYAEFLHRVEKPARYTGGEVGSIRKDWAGVEATICLAFPDIYDIGMSHLGYKILYDILNRDPRTLAERAYAPWPDMEAELRTRGLPLVSHESSRPLRDFDVVGLSLQFELTYTNCLTMLDLGGIPLRTVDRGEGDPLVLGGGPVATHPEPVAAFFDAFVIGDGEAACTMVALAWTRLKREGVPRARRLVELSKLPGVYVPSLYEVAVDEATGLQVVVGTRHPDAPRRVRRTLVPDLNEFPFPALSPIGGPEAIFDRMSIEIARGCTEGCRFCQAGMIYRPVRERDPEQIVATVVEAVKKSGQDEVSLTSLSTADTSCIAPLIKRVVEKLQPEQVSLGVSSLRAYGLSDDLLDEIKQVRATGLTFAPEAGTQRMRDVVNKNVTEEQLIETAQRIFGKGWERMKLYFMIGLPTEEDEDVRGIVETGRRALDAGKEAMRQTGRARSLGRATVTVSVSTHVPKPHTPFQWCAMDTLDTIEHKQYILRDAARSLRVDLKTHDARESVLEGVFARGDRRLADPIEEAWRQGARFDSWEEHIKLDLWRAAFAKFGIKPDPYLDTIPVSARLPWDHLDIGLEDGFLAREYRRALQNRLSPPCGKAAGAFIHHTNVAEARADQRRLVCYDCGVACDMTQMREERIDFLQRMGADNPESLKRRLPLAASAKASAGEPSGASVGEPSGASVGEPSGASAAGELTESVEATAPVVDEVVAAGEMAALDAIEAGALAAIEAGALAASEGADGAAPAPALKAPKATSKARAQPPSHGQPKQVSYRYRLSYEKLGPVAFLGHLDLIRALPRVLRRSEIPVAYTGGFHPKPDMVFGPALSLGVPSLGEFVDVKLAIDIDPEELRTRMNASVPEGLHFTGASRLGPMDPGISKIIGGARYALVYARSALPVGGEAWLRERAAAVMAATTLPVTRTIDKESKSVDVRAYLRAVTVDSPAARAALGPAGLVGDLVTVEIDVLVTGSGAVKASEVAEVLGGAELYARSVRLELMTDGGESPLAIIGRPRPRSATVAAENAAPAE